MRPDPEADEPQFVLKLINKRDEAKDPRRPSFTLKKAQSAALVCLCAGNVACYATIMTLMIPTTSACHVNGSACLTVLALWRCCLDRQCTQWLETILMLWSNDPPQARCSASIGELPFFFVDNC